VRDELIEIRGFLGFRDRIPLRGIFTAVLSRDRPLELLDKEITDNPKLADTQITQLVIRDGWLGVALGPLHRTALYSAPVRATVAD
jgi:hypothetical protein